MEQCGADVNAAAYGGETPLNNATYNKALDIIRYLAQFSCNAVNAKDSDEQTALYYACARGKLYIVRCFVDQGRVDVNPIDRGGKTALHLAKSQMKYCPTRIFLLFMIYPAMQKFPDSLGRG